MLDVYCIELADEADTLTLGRQIARCVMGCEKRLVTVYLKGDLGTGKTTLTRGILREFGHQGAVKSPTYTLVEEYRFPQCLVHHFDIYRLGHPEELEYMGIRDFFDTDSDIQTLVLVEWPEKGGGILPSPDLTVELEVMGESRKASLQSKDAAFAEAAMNSQ